MADLSDLDLDEPASLLVVLKCPERVHAYTVSTLDGCCRLQSFYRCDQSTGQWIEPIPLSEIPPEILSEPLPSCPECRVPIQGVQRYNRVIKWCQINLQQRIWVVTLGGAMHTLCAQLRDLEGILGDATHKSTFWKRLNVVRKELKRHSRPSAPSERARLAKADTPNIIVTQENQGKAVVEMAWASVCALEARGQLCAQELEKFEKTFPKANKSADDCLRFCRLSATRNTQRQLLASHMAFLLHACRGLAELGQAVDSARARTRELREDAVVRAEALARAHPTECAPFLDALSNERTRLDGPFYQPVTKDELAEVVAAMTRDVGAGVGSFGGHWYTCPNGHPYAIGECGGAMHEAMCNECGASIGGSDHRLRSDNRPALHVLQGAGLPQPGANWREEVEQNLYVPPW